MQTNKLFILAFLLVLPTFVFAQESLRSQYQFNYLGLNPAFTGEHGNFNVTGIMGNQFAGSANFNQISQIVAIDAPMFKDKNALGFQGFRQNYGTVTTSGANLNYAYKIDLQNVVFKVGVDAGIINLPLVATTSFTQNIKPYAGFGVLASFDGLTLGLSSPLAIASANSYQNQPILGQILYRKDLSSQLAVNLSSILEFNSKNSIKDKGFDLNFKTWLMNKVGLGVSYRTYSLRTTTEKRTDWVPSLEAKFGTKVTLGLAYNSNSFYNTASTSQNQGAFGVFQLLLRYNANTPTDNSGILQGF